MKTSGLKAATQIVEIVKKAIGKIVLTCFVILCITFDGPHTRAEELSPDIARVAAICQRPAVVDPFEQTRACQVVLQQKWPDNIKREFRVLNALGLLLRREIHQGMLILRENLPLLASNEENVFISPQGAHLLLTIVERLWKAVDEQIEADYLVAFDAALTSIDDGDFGEASRYATILIARDDDTTIHATGLLLRLVIAILLDDRAALQTTVLALHERIPDVPEVLLAKPQTGQEERERAATLHRNGIRPALAQAEHALAQGDLEGAERAIERLAPVWRSLPEIRFVRAVLADRHGRWKQALALAGEVLQAQPTHKDALLLRASVFQRLGRFDEGKRDAWMAIGLAHGDGEVMLARHRLAELLTAEGMHKEAETQHRRALAAAATVLRMRPDESSAKVVQAASWLRLYGRERSRQAIDLLRTTTDPTAALWLGHALRMAGEPQDAIAAYETALRAVPGWSDIWFALGNAWLDMGVPSKARAALIQAAALGHPHAAAVLVRLNRE